MTHGSVSGRAPGLKMCGFMTCAVRLLGRALALGKSLPMIGKLLGHTQFETTARYAHLARDSVQGSAVRIAADILDDRHEPGIL